MSEIPTQRVPYPEKKESRLRKPFPVLIGVPVPSIDNKISSGLSGFCEAASSRQLAIRYRPEADGRFAKCSRNMIIDEFLHSRGFKQFDYLFFCDHDCYPVEPLAMERLISLNKDVICGVTPIMFNRFGEMNMWFNVQREDGTNMFINELPQEPFKAYRVGGTCMLIKRHVLEAMEPPYYMDTFDEKHISFNVSEDYYFCDKVRANEFDIWVDPHIWNHHFHNVDLCEILMMINRLVGLNVKVAVEQANPQLAATKAKILEMAGKE